MSRFSNLAKNAAAAPLCRGIITKVNSVTRQVEGIIASETPDHAGEIFDYDSSKPLFIDWSTSMQKASNGASYGNVRSMHGLTAAGKLDSITFDDAVKCVKGVATIVDDDEWKKVEAGVYTGFSMGGSYVGPKWDDPAGLGKRYTGKPSEVSLVDAPCIPDATFTIVKADGTEELRKFAAPVASKDAAPTGATENAAAASVKIDGADAAVSAQVAKAMGLASLPEGVTPEVGARAVVLLKRREEPDIKAAIETAAKLTQAMLKADQRADLSKGLWDITSLAYVLMDLDGIACSAANERMWEGDNSKVPEQLLAALKQLAEALISMTKEETSELLAYYEKSAPVADLAKAAPEQTEEQAQVAAVDAASETEVRALCKSLIVQSFRQASALDALTKTQATHTAACTHGTDAGKGTGGGDLAKINAALDESTSALSKARADNVLLKARVDALEKQNAELLKTPPTVTPPRLVALEKGAADGTVVKVDAVDATTVTPVAKADGNGVDDVATLIKKAHATGGIRVM